MHFQSISQLSHLSDHAVLSGLRHAVENDRTSTAQLLSYLSETDARKLYLPLGYDSMYAYCVRELRMSEDVAFKRIRVARVARRFPRVLEAIALGRLTLSAVVALAPHLTEHTADLLVAAENRTNAQIELLLAERFPRPDMATLLITSAPAAVPPATSVKHACAQLAVRPPVPCTQPESGMSMGPLPAFQKLTPLSPGRVGLQVTLAQTTHDKLRRAQELLGHAVPTGAIAEVLDRALDALISELERRRCAKTEQLREALPLKFHAGANARQIPASIRRAVHHRDRGQCTFVGAGGKRCESRARIELDHVVPIARGGESTVENLRLLCRAHNQHVAERELGASYMQGRREQAREQREKHSATRANAQPSAQHRPARL